ncbi:hypothetical protein D021_2412B, partial [Vibrio parahaemolyticus 10296]
WPNREAEIQQRTI